MNLDFTLPDFRKLTELPPNSDFWKNDYMFTKPVVSQESRQFTDFDLFTKYFKGLPVKMKKYLLASLRKATV